MASLENIGSWRALDTLPPTQIEMPSRLGVVDLHRRADGVAVAAVHALRRPRSRPTCLPSTVAGRMAPVGQEETRVGISQTLGSSLWSIIGHLGVHAEHGDVGAVHRAAHVEAAGEGDAQLARQVHVGEVRVQLVHDRLDHAGGVGGRRVAVHPALGVDDVGDGVADAADEIAQLVQVLLQRLDLATRR